jgi:hypothetical protein
MVKVPAAQPTARVPRSRRDDRYQPGYPPPPKRAVAGYVTSIQDSLDTVTVVVCEEPLTGVIPLGAMPAVGDVVEVESRGDLLVIPYWLDVEEPLDSTTIDVPLTRGRHIQHEEDGSTTDEFLDAPLDVTFTWNAYSGGSALSGTKLYPVEWDGQPADGSAFIPATPAGMALDEIRPIVKAYLTGGSPDTITADTSGWGYSPPPTLSPYLLTDASSPLTFDTFPTSEPADPIECGAGFTLADEQFQSALAMAVWLPSLTPPYSTDPRQIVLTYWALRFFYSTP